MSKAYHFVMAVLFAFLLPLNVISAMNSSDLTFATFSALMAALCVVMILFNVHKINAKLDDKDE